MFVATEYEKQVEIPSKKADLGATLLSCLLLLSVNDPFRLKRGSHAYFQLQWLVPWKINKLYNII